MIVQLFAICDFASVEQGKLFVIGAFSSLSANSIPFFHPRCSVAARFIFRKDEEGEHQLRFIFADADGQPVIEPVLMPLQVTFKQSGLGAYFADLAMNLQQIRFRSFGEHVLILEVDGKDQAQLPLFVSKAEAI